VSSEFSGDVMDVLGQLFEAGAAALDDGDPDTARQCLTSAETVATNKLPDSEFRSRLLHGCDRALATVDGDGERPGPNPGAGAGAGARDRPTERTGDDLGVAAEHCRVMARQVDSRR
jgi:hypothetical protein